MTLAFVQIVAFWCQAILLLAITLCAVRMLRGPHQSDRVIALDLITVLAAVVLGLLCIRHDETAYLSVALALALVAFLGTVAWSFYIRRRAREMRENEYES